MKCGQNHKSEDTSPSWEHQTHLKKVFKGYFKPHIFHDIVALGHLSLTAGLCHISHIPQNTFLKPHHQAQHMRTKHLSWSIFFTRCINSSIKCPLEGLGFAISREFFDQIKASLENTLNESLGEKHQNKNKHGHLWGRAWVGMGGVGAPRSGVQCGLSHQPGAPSADLNNFYHNNNI